MKSAKGYIDVYCDALPLLFAFCGLYMIDFLLVLLWSKLNDLYCPHSSNN